MKKLSYFLVLLLLIFPLINGATIKGNVFDVGLDRVENAIVEINTVPIQRVVATDGTYSFSSIPMGDYQIKATTLNRRLTTNENITILKEGGIYNIDLFLIPELDGETEESNISLYILISLAIIILIIAIIFYKKKKRKKEPEKSTDEDLNKVLDIIKKEGNRTTQKHIREQLGLSEAKVSLMVTELEDKGFVKRIRKGRSNVIILKEKQQE